MVSSPVVAPPLVKDDSVDVVGCVEELCHDFEEFVETREAEQAAPTRGGGERDECDDIFDLCVLPFAVASAMRIGGKLVAGISKHEGLQPQTNWRQTSCRSGRARPGPAKQNK